jgi:hypothetical protein
MCRTQPAIPPGFILLSFCSTVLRVGVSACRLSLSRPRGNGPSLKDAIDEGESKALTPRRMSARCRAEESANVIPEPRRVVRSAAGGARVILN